MKAKARKILGASKRRGGDGETVGPRDQGICVRTGDAITVMRESEIARGYWARYSENSETMPKLVVRRFIGPTII